MCGAHKSSSSIRRVLRIEQDAGNEKAAQHKNGCTPAKPTPAVYFNR
jgi:hypothetical protein